MDTKMLKRRAWLAELAGTAGMVGFGLLAVGFFWSAASPAAAMPVGDATRRLITGFFFAGGATLLIYSPLGRISGGHINPSVTLAFLTLRKIRIRDAVRYIGAQLTGGILGVMAPWLVLVQWLGWSDAIAVGATQPGTGFPLWIVVIAEIIATAILMLTILLVSNRPRVNHLTPLIAGIIVMTAVWAEAHVSGTSLNEARSLAPAIMSGIWHHHWVYVVAPIIGAQLGALIYRVIPWGHQVLCCKLIHDQHRECHFEACAYPEET
ncbi:MAG: aquaporin [Spirochaeta sp.]|nr:aquaporin [Spirochaeta sp.]